MTRVLATSAAVAAVLVGATGIGTTAVAVAATDWRPVAETGTPGRLVLHTGPEPLVLPGAGNDADVTWQVRTSVDEPGPVTLDLQLTGRGGLPGGTDGVLVSVATCEQPWGDPSGAPTCGGQTAALVDAVPLVDWATTAPSVRVPDPDGDGSAYLLVRLSLGDAATTVPRTAEVGVGVTARGGDPVVPGRPTHGDGDGSGDGGGDDVGPVVLAMTGGGFAGPVLVAVAAVLAGVALRFRRPGSRS
ncbi:hypothetical protein EDF48_10217 [Curtobacterium sp. PhB191]|uniref:hypothetical protein n=1 Tax=Curtobacterium sp. PhB191 TaxID=2485202 RepID=UPI001050D165|nr:hypothetical protein [Curtobacterium sp. PhB191]TCU86357.1 hypothetical protein EDF48_10217 [Curtobacterium sp. PhB191]